MVDLAVLAPDRILPFGVVHRNVASPISDEPQEEPMTIAELLQSIITLSGPSSGVELIATASISFQLVPRL